MTSGSGDTLLDFNKFRLQGIERFEISRASNDLLIDGQLEKVRRERMRVCRNVIKRLQIIGHELHRYFICHSLTNGKRPSEALKLLRIGIGRGRFPSQAFVLLPRFLTDRRVPLLIHAGHAESIAA